MAMFNLTFNIALYGSQTDSPIRNMLVDISIHNVYIKWRYVSCILQQIHDKLHSDHQWWDNKNGCAFYRKCIARIK